MTGDGRFWRSFAKEAEFLKTLKMQLRNREDLLESNFGRWIQIWSQFSKTVKILVDFSQIDWMFENFRKC